jgi:hypothetical protein
LVHTQTIILYFYRPLPKPLCTINWFLGNVIVVHLLILLDAMAVIKYALIFWIKSPEMFSDDFWSHFVNIGSTVFRYVCMCICRLCL